MVEEESLKLAGLSMFLHKCMKCMGLIGPFQLQLFFSLYFCLLSGLKGKKYFVELFSNTFTKLIWKSEGIKNRHSLLLVNGDHISLK